MKRILASGMMAFMALSGSALAEQGDAEQKGLTIVKQFTIDHNERLISQSQLLNDATARYYAIIEANGFDYAKAWQAEGKQLAVLVGQIRDLWLEASNQYETIEGIVAGLPSTAKYDLIIDAGNPGTESEDVAPYDLTLPDGTVMKRPGNLFHGITEPTFWGMNKDAVKFSADFNGDGKTDRSEILPDANLSYGATQALLHWSQEMLKDVKAWKPNRDDAFTAVVTMTPTVGDYFGEWKESQFITAEIGAFVAQSRLVDVKGIMGGCKKMYFTAISPVVADTDAALDTKIRTSYNELLALVEDTYAREKSGASFKPEEADALGNEAQDIADRIVAMISQAAKKLDVQLKI